MLLFVGIGLIVAWFYFQNHHSIFEKQTTQTSLSVVDNQDEDSECPLEGSAISEEVKALNVLKNRAVFPTFHRF